MFYSTGRHRFNSGWLVCGTRWAPCVDNNSSIYRGITFTHCRAALPLLLVTSQVSGCLQPSCRSSQNTKKWCRTAPHPPVGSFSASWTCKRSQVCMCLSSYTTHPNIKCSTFQLRTRLLLKTQLVLYSEKSVTGKQGLCCCCLLVSASRYLQSLLDWSTF